MPVTFATVAPHDLSPRRPVPTSIARPEYVDRPRPQPFTGSEVKDADTIERMRVAGRIAAQAMAAAAAAIARAASRHASRIAAIVRSSFTSGPS